MYLLDANIFITSKNAHYGFDFVPAFWEWLDQGHSAGVLCSIDRIADELRAAADDLSTWASGRAPMFLRMDQATLPSLALVSTWASTSDFTAAAVSQFLSVGDFQLVAYAHAHGHTVVTHEKSAPQATRRIKIPDACAAMGVPCIDPFTMLRAESVRFVLPGASIA
ncbi:uncharacterized protein DUF4411 [Rathayibacter sp. PhB152]|uniref:DUF4411 family protein n=1 Tax=unclassified Rathayibacter TaxID=2609250 RepID=UPI000F4CD987|nr:MULTISPECIES: DUF4411 family protein [unclassified Rathayibacter]ROQ64834.1 uncharacterized protein DUF4411 [Rathayibacter sp. PhB152]TDX81471.1 uncharacterized protein DUF4411 [Rathayibacter sp. PhB151]